MGWSTLKQKSVAFPTYSEIKRVNDNKILSYKAIFMKYKKEPVVVTSSFLPSSSFLLFKA